MFACQKPLTRLEFAAPHFCLHLQLKKEARAVSFNPKGVFSRLACLLVLSAALAPAATAQRVNADLTGRVLDQNGAAVTNATVTARNLGTSAQRSTQTNDNGDYELRELPPGRYELTVEAQNFSKAVVR